MAFTVPYRIKFSDKSCNDSYRLEFLHEIIKTPLPEEKETLRKDGFKMPHTQDFYELIFFNSGSRDIEVEGNIRKFSEGDVLIISPGEAHCGRSHDCVLDRYYIHIGKDVFSSLADGGKSIMAVFDKCKKTGNNCIRPSSAKRAELRSFLMNIDNIIRFSDESTKDIEIYAIIIRILSLLSVTQTDSKQNFRNETLLSIMSYIENSYPDSNVINNAAKNIGVSRSTLRRMFKDELFTTPSEYLLQIRLQNARLLLESGDSVTDTAMKCGFSDCSHFIKKFKAKFSVTPRKYRCGIRQQSVAD